MKRTLSLLSLLLPASICFGQQDEPTKKPQTDKPEPVEFVDRFEKMFAGRDPKLGATIDASVSAYDASGKPFSFANTRGKHTVIVFGCLT